MNGERAQAAKSSETTAGDLVAANTRFAFDLLAEILAAAATMVVMVRSISQPFRMVVDRPFFFAICDDHFEPGAVLFMGVVTDP